jgi:hypothetical protein
MSHFYAGIPYEEALRIEPLSQLAYTLREGRKQLLQRYGVDQEAALLELIRNAAVPEHPAYEHYLGALALADSREQVRGQLSELLAGQGQ